MRFVVDGKNFLKIKLDRDNLFAYFPITRNQLERYFQNQITTRELLVELDQFSFINNRYNEISNSLKAASHLDILNQL